jgi:Cu(I)/Ag(I) efflux system membrane protein CusA/SilA
VIVAIIAWSIRHRWLVVLMTAVLALLGVLAAERMRLDAIPDLSDVQVIVVADHPGQNPEVVDEQVTYPLSTALLAVPGATVVRGVSMFETTFVYVLFEDGTDIYWARSRVLEQLDAIQDRLPEGVRPRLGPDATGVGWVLQYALLSGPYCPAHERGLWHDEQENLWYAAPEAAPSRARARLERVRVFESGGTCPLDGGRLVEPQLDLADLRSLQDWYLRFPLTAVDGVSEVAAIGGFVRETSVRVDPLRLQAFGLSLDDVAGAIERSNQNVGGSVIELAESEYMVQSRGTLRGLEDLERVAVGRAPDGAPIRLGDVAEIEIGGAARRGVGELDGRGEVAGGVVIARSGENAHRVIRAARAKLFELEAGLPAGVSVLVTYDRSQLIERAVGTLRTAVLEELVVVALVCLAFLLHLRSALVAILVLPVGLLVSILVMQVLGINANIMSLGGLALAIGVMVDSAVVMIENAHKHLERGGRERTRAILDAACEVGPSLFASLLVITVAFLPIFALGEESGRLFRPLAFTKTFAIAAGALLGITLVPALMIWFVRGRIPSEESNPLNRLAMRAYEPFFNAALARPWLTLALVIGLGASTLYPLRALGSEFMPPLDEGDLLYMPTTDPSLSVGKSQELLQQSDELIASFPEVLSVHGKIGRAETATDPAPLSMIETVVRLETDRSRWRRRPVERFWSGWPAWLAWPFARSFWRAERALTTPELLYGWTDPDGTAHLGLNQAVRLPGVANAWPYPIENRINMLATGIKTPVGIKHFGPDLDVLAELAERTAAAVRVVPGTTSAYAERTGGGRYLDVDIDRERAARHGLTTLDVQEALSSAVGGKLVTTTLEGPARYPVRVRYPRELRDDPEDLERVHVPTPHGAPILLGDVAQVVVRSGAPMIRSENAQRTAWVFVDIAGRDLGGYVEEAKRVIEREVPLPSGYTRAWSGRFEALQEANRRLELVLPITLALIVLLLYLAAQSWFRVAVILLAVPFSLIGAFWFLWWLDYDLSLAVWVGIIALLGVDAETGVVMLLYLDSSYESRKAGGRMRSLADLRAAIHEGAVKRLRPKAMTVATDMIGLLPLLWATGTGADVTRRMVAPLIGGIAVSFLMELLVYPVVFLLWKRRGLAREALQPQVDRP